MKNILEIRDLRVRFRDPADPSRTVQAVDGVSLDVAEGSFTSIVGESGSGKSVTALSIARLIDPLAISGRILYKKQQPPADLLKLSSKELIRIRGREIAYVFQDPGSSLNPVLTVGAQLEETGSGSKAAEMLRAVGMVDAERVRKSFPHELSGGMRQRVMIAMALLGAPNVFVADEPTTALDTETETEIMELLAAIRRQRQLTVVFITHDLKLAEKYSDRVYVMKEGRIVEALEKETGFNRREAYTKKLFAASLGDSVPKTILSV